MNEQEFLLTSQELNLKVKELFSCEEKKIVIVAFIGKGSGEFILHNTQNLKIIVVQKLE